MNRPKIVCLCGSTRFAQEFAEAALSVTLAGEIYLSVGSMTHSDESLKERITPEVKTRLDELHKRKIDLADSVYVVSRNGYFGVSTRSEVDYAIAHGKPVRWMETAAELAYTGIRQKARAEALATAAKNANEATESTTDVANPAYYDDHEVAPIDLIHDYRLDFPLGNVVKYVARHREKNGVDDLRKALWYLMWALDFDKAEIVSVTKRATRYRGR
jgi:hypothetical protein